MSEEVEPGEEPIDTELPFEARVPLDRDGKASKLPYDADGQRRDKSGRKTLTQMGWMSFLRGEFGTGIAMKFRTKVPAAFWTAEVDGTTEVAVVACPCGESPHVKVNHSTECDCERIYLYVGDEVRVGNSPAQATTAVPT